MVFLPLDCVLRIYKIVFVSSDKYEQNKRYICLFHVIVLSSTFTN